MDAAFVLPETDKLFGESNNSIYADTPYSVLLEGSIDVLLFDLQFLNPVNTESLNNCFF